MRWLILVVALWLALPVCAGDAARKSLPMARTAAPPVIDGRLDDAVWQQAAVIDDLTQTEPDEARPPSERTLVYLLLDAENLYIGVRAFDRDPAAIVATHRQRDSELWEDDSVALLLDSFDDRRHGYYLATNPLGARSDGLLSATELTMEWDGIWQVASSVDAEGWVAEFAIPLSTLSFNPANDRWGFNVERSIARRNEADRWTALARNQSLMSLADMGELTGLHGLGQGHSAGIDLVPHLLARSVRDASVGHNSSEFDAGLDAYFRPTPESNFALTLNTDFAEADVDQRVINLSRFPISLPEKRGFFLQDAHYFHYADTTPFYSRRIGVADDGTRIPLRAGLKTTGRAGPLTYGVLAVETQATAVAAQKDLFVGRAKLDIGAESTLGLVVTRGNPAGNTDNRLAGVDVQLSESNLFGSGQILTANVYFLNSLDAGKSANAYGASVAYPNDRWSASAAYSQAEAAFNPALGFAIADVKTLSASLKRTWRPAGVQAISLAASASRRTDFAGTLLDSSLAPATLSIESKDHYVFSYSPTLHRENYASAFQLLPGIQVEPDSYAYWQHNLQFTSPSTSRLSGSLGVGAGDYLDGSQRHLSAGATWRPNDWLSLYPTWQVDDYRFAEARFMLRVAELSASLGFSPSVGMNLVAQHDNLSNELLLNARLRYTLAAGSDVFVVWGRNIDTTEGRFRTNTTELVAKVAWTVRY